MEKKYVYEWLEEDEECVRECLEECVTDTAEIDKKITKEEYESIKELCLLADDSREACMEHCEMGW